MLGAGAAAECIGRIVTPPASSAPGASTVAAPGYGCTDARVEILERGLPILNGCISTHAQRSGAGQQLRVTILANDMKKFKAVLKLFLPKPVG